MMKINLVSDPVSRSVIAILILLLLIALSSFAFAHGKKAHNPDGKKSEHMQAMMAAKKDIPEEYRIMDRTPLMPTDDSLQQGEKFYLQNCSVCHGEKGDGKGPAASAMKTQPANFLETKHSAIYGPGEKYWIIANGIKKTGMPAFTQFAPTQRWSLVNYIYRLQKDSAETQ